MPNYCDSRPWTAQYPGRGSRGHGGEAVVVVVGGGDAPGKQGEEGAYLVVLVVLVVWPERCKSCCMLQGATNKSRHSAGTQQAGTRPVNPSNHLAGPLSDYQQPLAAQRAQIV